MRSALDTAPGIFASTEVGRAALEEGLVLVAGDVDAYIGAPALRVAHLAEHPAVGGEDALDGLQGAVGVGVDVHGGRAGGVHVLGGDLAVGDQPLQLRLGGCEAALAVGDGDGVEVAHMGLEMCIRDRFCHAWPQVAKR